MLSSDVIFTKPQPRLSCPKGVLLASRKTFKSWVIAGVILGFLGSQPAQAEDIKKLAEEVQNPVSDLVRVGLRTGHFSGMDSITIFRTSSICSSIPPGNGGIGRSSTGSRFPSPIFQPRHLKIKREVSPGWEKDEALLYLCV